MIPTIFHTYQTSNSILSCKYLDCGMRPDIWYKTLSKLHASCTRQSNIRRNDQVPCCALSLHSAVVNYKHTERSMRYMRSWKWIIIVWKGIEVLRCHRSAYDKDEWNKEYQLYCNISTLSSLQNTGSDMSIIDNKRNAMLTKLKHHYNRELACPGNLPVITLF